MSESTRSSGDAAEKPVTGTRTLEEGEEEEARGADEARKS